MVLTSPDSYLFGDLGREEGPKVSSLPYTPSLLTASLRPTPPQDKYEGHQRSIEP